MPAGPERRIVFVRAGIGLMRRAPISVPSIREWAIGAFCNFTTSVQLRIAIELFDRDCGRVGRFNARASRQQTTEAVSRRVSLRGISALHDRAAIAKRSKPLSCRIVCDEPVCTSSENALAGQQGPGGADDGHHEATGQDTDHRIGDGLQHRWSLIVGSGRCALTRAWRWAAHGLNGRRGEWFTAPHKSRRPD